MNPNYVHTITLYNCLKAVDSADRKEHWYRTVIKNCFYKAKAAWVQGSTGDTLTQIKRDNTYTVRIPESEKQLAYREWAELPETSKKDFFTIAKGDLVIYGECTQEITGDTGKTATQVLNRYKPDSFKIVALSDNTMYSYAKHYRLEG